MCFSNFQHYQNVKIERKKRGLDICGIRHIELNHALLNSTIKNNSTNKIFKVKKVTKSYIEKGFGWVIEFLLEDDSKNTFSIIYENINNDSIEIIYEIEQAKLNYSLT